MIKGLRRKFHDAQAVFEPRVDASRIDQILHCQLTHVPQSLEGPMVNDLPFILRIPDESVHGTSYPLRRLVLTRQIVHYHYRRTKSEKYSLIYAYAPLCLL